MAAMVRNPLYDALQQAVSTIGPMIEQINADVDRPCRMFHSGKVWTGPAAKQFDAQLARFSARARNSGQAIVEELRLVLSRTPSEGDRGGGLLDQAEVQACLRVAGQVPGFAAVVVTASRW